MNVFMWAVLIYCAAVGAGVLGFAAAWSWQEWGRRRNEFAEVRDFMLWKAEVESWMAGPR